MKKICFQIMAFLLATVLLLGMIGCDELSSTDPEDTGTTGDPAVEETTDPDEETTAPPCAEHSYDGGVVVEAAKALCDGMKLFTCAVCGHTYEETIPMTKSLKVLAIGNSFSKNTTEYLTHICKDAGIETIVIGNLYIASCSLEKHWTNISAKNAAYEYFTNAEGFMKSVTKTKSIQAALADEKWDVVTLQQASGTSGVPSSFDPYLNNILTFLEANRPAAHTEIIWNMTWAYQADSDHLSFPTYNKNQLTMYQKIVECVETKINTDARFAGVIPTGTAIQNLRTSYVGDTVTQDGYHLNASHGKYIAALTWYAYLTGGSPDLVDWAPMNYKQQITADMDVIHEAVENALKDPLKVTASTKPGNAAESTPATTDADRLQQLGLNIDNYQLLDWQPKLHSYYNSTGGMTQHHSGNSTASNLPKFTSSCILQKSQLPIGSVIIVDAGYQYRPEGWASETSKNTSSTRPANVSTNAVVTDAAWWGSFNYRAFNLARTNSATMTEADSAHLRIYVPKAN